MRKTVGLFALTAGIIAAGCAVLPHAVKVPVAGVSGPVTLNLTGIPYASGRSTQALKSTTKSMAVIVYKSNTTYGPSGTSGGCVAPGLEVEKDPVSGAVLVSTASITSSATSFTLPRIPAGPHVIKVYVFNAVITTVASQDALVDHVTGAVTDGAPYYEVGEAETYVSPIVGVPLAASLPVYSTIDHAGTLQTRTGATGSVSFSGVVPSTTGNFYLRLPSWNPYTEMASAVWAGYAVRVSITSPTAWTSALQTSLASGGASFSIGDISTPKGFSPAKALDWYWSSDGKTAYTNIYPAAATVSADGAVVAPFMSPTLAASSSVSMIFNKSLLPTGYTLYMMDFLKGSSLPGNGTL